MAVHLQPRDVQILTELGEFGMLDTDMIRARYWPDAKNDRACQERLKLLREESLVRTALLSVNRHGKQHRVPAMHFLTPAGAEVVQQQTGIEPKRVARSDPKPFTLLHRWEGLKARLAFDAACANAKLDPPKWILEQDLVPGTETLESLSARKILYDVYDIKGRKFTCRPDAASLLRLPTTRDGEATKFAQLISYWEIDRATESNFRAKLPGYSAFVHEKSYRRHWLGLNEKPAVRVFVVCPSQERINNIVASIKSFEVSKDFRFIVKGDVVPERILKDRVWMDTAGGYRAILQS
jgi:hypothetical protein